ncbi:MAG: flagellar motor switch protein FliN [SAR324 cluster bacterium]|nr:flagellar motor switch protein FliN [SAR324 cluster bacterium]
MAEEIAESEEVAEEETEQPEASAEEGKSVDAEASRENGDAESDLDSLMSEVGAKESVEESPARPGDLSSLVTEAGDKEKQDLDSMLESTEPVPVSADDEEQSMNVEFLLEMPLTVTFEVGRAKMEISDLLSLGQGSVLELHRLVGETLDLMVNNRLIARGEVVVINEKFGARLTEIIPPEERIKRMGGMDSIS